MTPEQVQLELFAQAFVDWYLRGCGSALQRALERVVGDALTGGDPKPMSRQEWDVVRALYRALQVWHLDEIGAP